MAKAKKTQPDHTTQLMAKGQSGGDEALEKQALHAMENETQAWEENGAVKPPYAPTALLKIVEKSSTLPQTLTGYATGVDGYGHRFEAVIDLAQPDIEDKILAAIQLEREADAAQVAQEKGEEEFEVDYEVSTEEILERKEILERQIHLQKFKAQSWFEAAPQRSPFVELRRQMRWDMHAIGHGALEFARDEADNLRQVGYVPGHTILPAKKRLQEVESTQRIPVSPISFREISMPRSYGLYIQSVNGKKKYYKELGDQRIVSQLTGKLYKTEQALKAKEKNAKPATEILYFNVHSPLSSAGVPDWIGQLPNVLGARAAEETNYTYFDNKAVPPGAWVIIGGTLPGDVKKDLQNHIKNNIKKRSNFHDPLIIELAAPPGARSDNVEQPKVEWISFAGDQRSDASFLKYLEFANDKVGSSLRMPRLFRGDNVSDLARANIFAAIQFTDTHVFAPERGAFDWIINTNLMPELGITLIKYVSNGPEVNDLEEIASSVDIFSKHGGMVPADVRKVASQALNLELDQIPEEWTQQPVALTLAGFAAAQMGTSQGEVGGQLLDAFGSESDPEKRDTAAKILKEYFARSGYELSSIRTASDFMEELDGRAG